VRKEVNEMELCNRCRGEFFEKQLDDDGLCEECRLIVDGHIKEEGVFPREELDASDQLAA
jgi:hypothetical protein